MTRRSVYILLAACILFVFGTAGCGKMGPPSPRNTEMGFSFSDVVLSPIGNCLAVQGRIVGALRNVERIDLELSPVDTSANCPTCPFNAREYGTFSLEDANYNMETGDFYFSYCPVTETGMYRWRLVGRNVYSGLPYAQTVPLIAVMPD